MSSVESLETRIGLEFQKMERLLEHHGDLDGDKNSTSVEFRREMTADSPSFSVRAEAHLPFVVMNKAHRGQPDGEISRTIIKETGTIQVAIGESQFLLHKRIRSGRTVPEMTEEMRAIVEEGPNYWVGDLAPDLIESNLDLLDQLIIA